MIFSLRVAVLSGDPALVDELRRACDARAHSLLELVDLRWLPACDVLVLDLDDALDRIDAVQAAHPTTAIVLVGDGERSVGPFRVLDRNWVGDRLADALELTWIGIPARTGDDASLDKRVG